MERRIIDLGEIILSAAVHKEKQVDSSQSQSSGFGITTRHTEVRDDTKGWSQILFESLVKLDIPTPTPKQEATIPPLLL